MIFFRTLSLRDPPLPILSDLVKLPWDGGGENWKKRCSSEENGGVEMGKERVWDC